jgi:hypothetical protein
VNYVLAEDREKREKNQNHLLRFFDLDFNMIDETLLVNQGVK